MAANLMLEGTVERVYGGSLYCDVYVGLYVARGDNVLLMGELVRAGRVRGRRTRRRSARRLPSFARRRWRRCGESRCAPRGASSSGSCEGLGENEDGVKGFNPYKLRTL